MKAGVYLADYLLDPRTATSQEPLDCPFSLAFGRESFFNFIEKPDNEYRLRRFGVAMHGSSAAAGQGQGPLLTGKCFLLFENVRINGADLIFF
jgi:hypothetical protein